MALFTFVLDYNGGTYISQARGISPKHALRRWGSVHRIAESGMSKPAFQKLAKQLEETNLVPLNGLSNVWCNSGSTRRGLALLNIVKTDY